MQRTPNVVLLYNRVSLCQNLEPHLAQVVDDAHDQRASSLVPAHQQRVVHHAQARQEGAVRPQRALKPLKGLLRAIDQ